MRFEAREINEFSEPVSYEDLVIGDVYFFLNFLDEAMLIPALEPVVYIGPNFDGAENGSVCFQDAETYFQGVRFGSNSEQNASFFTGSQNELSHVFRFEKALEMLMACSIRRQTLSRV